MAIGFYRQTNLFDGVTDAGVERDARVEHGVERFVDGLNVSVVLPLEANDAGEQLRSAAVDKRLGGNSCDKFEEGKLQVCG